MSQERQDPVVSHGRGEGRGNIGEDKTKYVDGEIVRTGDGADGAYSTGRGGAANIAGSPGVKTHHRADEIIPEVAMRPSQEDQEYHVGRGGEGNVHHADGKKDFSHDGLADKLKRKLFGKKVEKQEKAEEAPETTPNPATTT